MRQRRGLSFVEFIGCLVAMAGGVLLGSLYLGIDVQNMAVGVLEQAQVVAPGYFEHAAATSADSSVGQSSGIAAQSLTSSDQTDNVAVGAETDSSKQAETADSESSVDSARPAAKPEPTEAERREATRFYWDQLTACMLAEAQGRLRGEGTPEEWALYDYLSQRKQGHEAALAELEKLETFGVDERLLSHGEQVIVWHKSGIKLFEHALSLLSDGPGAKLTGPFAQSWQSAATQLRMEENLVVERHKAVANYLDREYTDEAPFVPAYQQH